MADGIGATDEKGMDNMDNDDGHNNPGSMITKQPPPIPKPLCMTTTIPMAAATVTVVVPPLRGLLIL